MRKNSRGIMGVLSAVAIAFVVFVIGSCRVSSEEEVHLPLEPAWDSSLKAFTLVGNSAGSGSRTIPALLKVEFANGKSELDFPPNYDFENNPDGYTDGWTLNTDVYGIPAWNALIPDGLSNLVCYYYPDVFRTAVPETTLEQSVFLGWSLTSSGGAVIEEIPRNAFGDSGRISLYGVWADGGESIRQALEDAVESAYNALNTNSPPEYDDELYIGNGTAISDNESLQNLVTQFNALSEEAAVLLQGEEATEEVDTDQGLEIIHYREYRYGRMNEVNIALQQILSNSAFLQLFVSPRTQSLSYTGTVRSITVVSPGLYEIELRGGSGGHIWSMNEKTATGGKGAHIKGRVNLTVGDVIKVRVGGEGVGSADFIQGSGFIDNSNSKQTPGLAGGWNGGGSGGTSFGLNHTGGSGGGGASDVRYAGTYSSGVNNRQHGVNTTSNGAGAASGGIDTLDKRIIVAAGGGGAAQSAEIVTGETRTHPGLPGGNAGEAGVRRGVASSDPALAQNFLYGLDVDGTIYYYGTIGPAAGSTTGSGAGNNSSASVLGIGGDGQRPGGPWEGTGGGGGGYYGGKSAISGEQAWTSGGAGGSSFVNTGGSLPTVTPQGSNLINEQYGHGQVIIRFIQ